MATKSPQDIPTLIRMAESNSPETLELEGSYSAEEIEEMVSTMRKMIRVRDVILLVNREYIRSAAQADDYRTEPPFKLQGSYRNMNRIAERVSPVMNDAELESLIYSQYENDAQTLTSGAEANLLKFQELTGGLSDEDAARWEDIKRVFRQNLKLRGVEAGDRFGQVVAQMSSVTEGLDAIREAVANGVIQLHSAAQRDTGPDDVDQIVDELAKFSNGIAALRETVNEGMQQMSRLANRPVAPTGTLSATFAPEASELLTKFVAELQMANRGQEPDVDAAVPGQPYKIQVVNKVPRLFLNVIREQFHLMQQWMTPLTELSNANRSGLDDVRQQLDEALKNYEGIIDKLADSE